jgi:hypothetical protein
MNADQIEPGNVDNRSGLIRSDQISQVLPDGLMPFFESACIRVNPRLFLRRSIRQLNGEGAAFAEF